ncbi:MAG: hypothetical protein M3250_10435 [Thermoproteota archaeon]|nr:hypothetical protein [Thermoproteota archaeon]
MDVEVGRHEEYQPKTSSLREGSDSGHMSVARQELVLKILSHTKVLVVPKAKHMIQVMNPEDLAKGLANFFANYPM